MADQLTQDQLDHFREVFSLFDADGGGSIDASELGECLRVLGQNPSPPELERMIAAVDVDGSGSIEFDEFCMMVTKKLQDVSPQQEMLAAFQELDLAHQGLLPVDDVRAFLTNMGEKLSDAEVDEMLAEFQALDRETGMVDYHRIVKGILSI